MSNSSSLFVSTSPQAFSRLRSILPSDWQNQECSAQDDKKKSYIDNRNFCSVLNFIIRKHVDR